MGRLRVWFAQPGILCYAPVRMQLSQEYDMIYDPFGGVMLPWRNAQKPMTAVIRWGNFPEYDQKLTEHCNSIPYVGMWVQERLCSRHDIDWLFYNHALLVHDQGESMSGGDEHAGNKTPDKDLHEYLAAANMMAMAESGFRRRFMRAFLLQYVRKPQWWQYMMREDRDTVVVLAEKFPREALLFDGTERLDYLASAVEGHHLGIKNDTETMIDHVLGNQVPKLDALVDEWAPFAGVWSPDLRHQLLSLGSK